MKAKFSFEEETKDYEEDKTDAPDTKPIPILNGFSIDIPLFKKEIVPNPHKDEEE